MSKMSRILSAITVATFLVLVACPTKTDDPAPTKVGDFSVALSGRVKDGTITEVITSGTPGDTQVLGIGAKTNAVTAVKGTSLEVWLVADNYVNADGTPKADTTDPTKKYVINWYAYDPTAASTSVSPATSVTAANEVLIVPAQSGNGDGRKKITVGDTLIEKAGGVVLVAQVYKGGTTGAGSTGLGVTKDRLAQYELTITKDATAVIAVTSATEISAKGFAKSTAVADADIAAAPVVKGTVTAGTGGANATVTLNMATAATFGTTKHIGFNSFTLLPAVADDGVLVTLAAVGIPGSGYVASTVANGLVTFTLTASSDKAKVTINLEDKYGRKLVVDAILDAKLT